MRPTPFIATFYLFLSLGPSFSQPSATEQREQAQRLLDQAKTALETARYPEAQSQLEEALKLYQALGDLKGTADTLGTFGQLSGELADWDKMYDYYTRALRAHRQIGDQRGLAGDLYGLGRACEGKAEYAEAMTYYRRALETARRTSDAATQGRSRNGIGRLYFRQSNFRKAAPHFEEATALSGQAGDRRTQAQALMNLAMAWDNLGEKDKALGYHHQALEIFQQIGDRRGSAQSLNNIGTISGIRGEFSEAGHYYQRALKIAQEIGDRTNESVYLNNLGLVSKHAGDYPAAIGYFRRAIQTAEETGNESFRADCILNLASAYYELTDYEPALDHYGQAFKLYQKLGDKLGAGLVLMSRGAVVGEMGDRRAELGDLEKALAIFQEIGAKDWIAGVLGNIGDVRDAVGDYRKALDSFEQARKMGLELGYKHGAPLRSLGRVYAQLGKFGRAKDFLEQALRADRQISDRRSEGFDLNALGEFYRRSGQHQKALTFFQRQADVARQIGDPESLSQGLLGMGQCLQALGRPDEAQESYGAAIQAIEGIRSKLSTEEHKIGFVGQKFSAYENVIHLLLGRHKTEPQGEYAARAFNYAERARARALLDLLAEVRVNPRSGIDEKLAEREKQILAHISHKQGQLLDAKITEEVRRQALSDLDKLEKEQDEIKRQIRRASPAYSDLVYPEPLTLEQVRSEVLEEGQALIEYFLGQERSFLWVVHDDKVAVYELAPRAELERRVRLYLELISQRPSSSTTKLHVEGSRRLYSELIFPAIGELRRARSLLVVPDGILYYLPFEALIGEGSADAPHYLVDDWPVSYAPSASVLGQIKKEYRQRAGTRPAKELLAFGDPVYSAESGGTQKAGERGLAELRAASLARLPFTAEEVRRIRRYFSSDRSRILLRQEAREEEAKSPQAAQFQILHFAAHGVFDEQRPRRSGILLAVSGQSEQDGFLQMHEIFNLKLNADLVVLSACRTALGQLQRGEGIVGLARAFLYAGAPSLVTSLWNVNDEASAEFMSAFYAHLAKGAGNSDALRQAKLEMLGSARYAHPYYWAPFILIGESASLVPVGRRSLSVWLTGAAILLVAVIGVIVWRKRRGQRTE